MANNLIPFVRVLNANDLNAGTSETDVECPSTAFTKVAYFQIPAQQKIALGSGKVTDNGRDDRAYIQVRLDSAVGQIAGKVRVGYTNANETNIQIVIEERTDNIGTASTVKLGEQAQLAQEDSYLVIYFQPDSTTTLDYSDSDNKILLPVTVYQ